MSLSFEVGCTYFEISSRFSPRTLDVPGSDLKNVCYLRTPDDANAIGKMTVSKV